MSQWKKTTVCVCRWNVHVVCKVCTGAMEVLNVALSSLPSLSLALRRRKRLSTLLSNMPKVLYTFYRRKQEKAFKTQTTEWKQCFDHGHCYPASGGYMFADMSWRAKSSLCRQPFNFLSCMRKIRHAIRKQLVRQICVSFRENYLRTTLLDLLFCFLLRPLWF